MYALNLGEYGRILSTCIVLPDRHYEIIVDELPDGNIYEYRYVDGEYIHDPLPVPGQPEAEPTADDVLNALLGVAE